MRLGDLPTGWRWATVEDVGSVQLGRQRSPKYHDGPNMRPYLRVANVFEDRIDIRDVKRMNFTPDEFERYKLHPHDILLNEGQTPELLGRPAMYRGVPEEVAFTNSLIRFRAGPEVDPRWALLVFRRHMHFGRFTRESRITTNIAHLSASRFKTVEFPVPPIEDQRRILDILEDHLSRLDAAEKYLDQVLSKSKWMHGAVLQSAIAATSTSAPETSGPTRAELLAERVASCPPRMIRGRPLPLPPPSIEVPWFSDWPTMSLEEITHPVRTISYGILKPGPNTEDGVPYVRVVNMRGDVLDVDGLHRTTPEIARQYARASLEPDDVLISIRGTYGRVVVVPESLAGANITQDTARLAFLPAVSPAFAEIVLRAPFAQHFLKRVARGVAVKGVNIGDLRTLPFPVPSLQEQAEIVSRTAETLSDLLASVGAAGTARKRSNNLRRALLNAAFNGRLSRLTARAVSAEPVESEELAGV